MGTYARCGIIYSGRATEATSAPANGRLDADDVVHIHTMEYHSATKNKKEGNFATCDNVEGTREHDVKRNEPEKGRYRMISLIRGIRETKQNSEAGSRVAVPRGGGRVGAGRRGRRALRGTNARR